MELKGSMVVPKTVQGPAKVLHTVSDSVKVIRGDIIVCDMTEPDWMDLFAVAGGIVTQQGGVLCHAAIVARQFNLPCVTNVHNCLATIKDGDRLWLDGKGSVHVLDPENKESVGATWNAALAAGRELFERDHGVQWGRGYDD